MSKVPDVSIVADDISVTYNNGHTAIHDLSINLTGHTTCGLVGINGSGKSTFFKSIMGLVTPQTGSIRLGGLPVKDALKRSLVAYVPQSEDIDWNFPILVRDVVMQGRFGFMGMLRRPSMIDNAQVDAAMDRLGVSDLAHRQIGELSGGQKKRVFLARALAQQSKIILLDEPYTGVDVKTENAIMELLCELRDEGFLMLVSTHNLGTVPDYCNEVVLLNRTVIAAGPTETSYTQENLEKTFGGVLKHIHLGGKDLHDDEDDRRVTIITDDERPAVFYGKTKEDSAIKRQESSDSNKKSKADKDV
ncbi:MAG: ATP-binding cassette domain-containing protein [Gammaproteobacteria bacterium]|nr:ATP-binding cassette domain-containing protein [Gammaproteobacteria bacterium]